MRWPWHKKVHAYPAYPSEATDDYKIWGSETPPLDLPQPYYYGNMSLRDCYGDNKRNYIYQWKVMGAL